MLVSASISTQCARWIASQSCTSQTGTHLSVKSYRRLTHQEFEDTFNHDEGVFTPNADGILESSNQSSPGILLRPLRHELSHVEDTLKERMMQKRLAGIQMSILSILALRSLKKILLGLLKVIHGTFFLSACKKEEEGEKCFSSNTIHRCPCTKHHVRWMCFQVESHNPAGLLA